VELKADWVVGFVDGEGDFLVNIHPDPQLSIGYQVLPEMVVVQLEQDLQILHALKRFFGFGTIRSIQGDRQCLRIHKLEGLEKVCEFFLHHPLKTRKSVDFHKFHRVFQLIKQDKHRERDGLLEIVDLALTMSSTTTPVLEQVRSEVIKIG
jgi:hypothetical protein